MNLGTIEADIKPIDNEPPSQYADRLGVKYASTVTDGHKKGLGQFFTPLKIAQFMAEFSILEKDSIKILDPGCGIGILSAALAETIATRSQQIKTIELVAFETDVAILPFAEECFRYLGCWLGKKNIHFTFFLCKNDFILHNSFVLTANENTHEFYDIVISNPPYFKLPKDDERAIAVKSVIYGQTNIYSIFMLIAAKLLSDNGILIFITPRSFCSGNYFRLFREIFFSIINLKTIHLFVSRTAAFKRDKVLQENIIVSGTKKTPRALTQLELPFEENGELTISTSKGIEDIKDRREKNYAIKSLINFNSYQKILHLPSSEKDEKVIKIFKTWTGSLSLYNLKISTGPVVDFRSIEMISDRATANTVPLIWLHNIEPMKFSWPRENGSKGKTKNQYIIYNEASRSRLLRNRNYVFLRRFSTKDDNRRLIAAPYFRNELPTMPMLGVENHLNYICHKEVDLSEDDTVGLAAILNSQLFDLYFRTFNGNINVSATELRDFPLPDFKLIRSLGKKINELKAANKPINIDTLILKIFHLPKDLSTIYG